MSTHSCNGICSFANGYGHIAQKVLCDDFVDLEPEERKEELRSQLTKRIEKDSQLLAELG